MFLGYGWIQRRVKPNDTGQEKKDDRPSAAARPCLLGDPAVPAVPAVPTVSFVVAVTLRQLTYAPLLILTTSFVASLTTVGALSG